MKLDEIVIIPDQTQSGITSFPTNMENVATAFLGKYIVSQGKVGNQIVFVVNDGKTYVGAMVASLVSGLQLTDKPLIMVQRTWVEPEYRRQSIMINLYRFVYNTLNYAILSDVEQTQATKNIWMQLIHSFNVKMLDTQTHQVSSLDIDSVYNNTKQYILFLEADVYKWMPPKSTMLRDYEFILEGAN